MRAFTSIAVLVLLIFLAPDGARADDEAEPTVEPTAEEQLTREVEAQMQKGDHHYQLGEYEAAAAYFNAARALAPKKAGPYLWMGMAQAAAGNCKEAVPSLERYLKMRPQPRPEARERLDECKKKLKMKPEAQKRSSPPLAPAPSEKPAAPPANEARPTANAASEPVTPIPTPTTETSPAPTPSSSAAPAATPPSSATPVLVGKPTPVKKKRPYWAIGVVGGVVVVGVALGVGLGLGLSKTSFALEPVR